MEQITKLSVNSLKVHPRNLEFFDDIEGDTYKQFKKSIQEDGIITPIVVAPDMVIVSGNQRYKACVDLGIELIPAIIREELINEDLKLRQLIAANFGRLSNDPAKMRKAVAEYVDLVGNKNGGDRKSEYQDDTLKTHKEIAKELNISVRDLQNILSLERNLIPELKQALDKGFISKTAALGICSKLDPSEQQSLLTELTSLLGDKANTNPQKDKVSATNTDIQKLTEEIKPIKTNKKDYRKSIPQTTIKHLINKTNGKCEICHWGGIGLEGILIPHHIHKYADTEDNSIENLILICPNCHNTIHTLENCKDERMIEIIISNIDLKIKNDLLYYCNILNNKLEKVI